MKNRPDDLRAIRAIDDIASSSPRRLFALSPNDVLVQVALPLVLILAIVTRLMVIGEALNGYRRGPVIMEMWKQQLIMRIDEVMDRWESSVQLPAFPDFERIQWEGALPADDRFQTLCREAGSLNRWEELKRNLYHGALTYRPDDASEDLAGLLDLYDPEAPVQPADPSSIPPEFVINAERRNYALSHIEDRMLQWKQQVERLQWRVVAECASRLPMEPTRDEALASAQMQRIAHELNHRGYPLLDSVVREYTQKP